MVIIIIYIFFREIVLNYIMYFKWAKWFKGKKKEKKRKKKEKEKEGIHFFFLEY